MTFLLLVAALVAPATAATNDAPLHAVSFAQWQDVLASHKGDLVVVDFWATWCVPCIERFPKMVALSQRYADRGVTFLAFSLDDKGDQGAIDRANGFARKQGGNIEHYVSSEDIPDTFANLGLLGIPAVKIYGRDGKLARTLNADDPNSQFRDEDVEKALKELLAE